MLRSHAWRATFSTGSTGPEVLKWECPLVRKRKLHSRLSAVPGAWAEVREPGFAGRKLHRLGGPDRCDRGRGVFLWLGAQVVREVFAELFERGTVASFAQEDSAIEFGKLGQRRIIPDVEVGFERAPERHHHDSEASIDRRGEA